MALTCAAWLCTSAALTPVLVDEAAFLTYAREFAAHPADPYGFEVFWLAEPQPAFEVTAPPVWPYWLGLSTRLLGTAVGSVGALVPVALLLCFSLGALLRRAAPDLADPLLVCAALSPSVWPSFNLMLDGPVLALSLAAIASFLAACDRGDLRRALLAGALAGLAMQTKYTGVVCVAVIGVQALLARRWRLGAVAAATAAGLFVAWELFVALRYGDSHFLYSARFGFADLPDGEPLLWSLGLLSLCGALFPAQGLLAAAALPLPRWLLLVGAGVFLAAFAALPALPHLAVSEPATLLPAPSLARGAFAVFLALGAIVVAAWLGLGLRAARAARGKGAPDALDALLLAWLAVEVAALYAIPPFLAARRVIGLGVVATLVAGRLLARRRGPGVRRTAWAVAATSALLGAIYAGGMISDARARQRLADTLPELGRQLACDHIYFAAHWGFQHHAEALGYTAISRHSAPARGDCIALLEGFPRQALRLQLASLEPLRVVGVHSAWPWSAVPSYFAGPIPLRPQPRWQARLTLYRVVDEGAILPPP